MRTFTKHTKYTLYFKARNDLIVWYFDWIQKYIDDNNIDGFKITGMKVKYGWLRIEWQWADDMLIALCTNLENDSEKTCWICGSKWDIRTDEYWWECLCWKHYMLRKARTIFRKIKNMFMSLWQK